MGPDIASEPAGFGQSLSLAMRSKKARASRDALGALLSESSVEALAAPTETRAITAVDRTIAEVLISDMILVLSSVWSRSFTFRGQYVISGCCRR